MTEQIDQRTPSILLNQLGISAESYFDKVEAMIANTPREDRLRRFERDHFWAELPQELREEAGRLTEQLISLMGQIATSVQTSFLASEADQRDVMIGTKTMRAALLLRQFHSWPIEVLHDEGQSWVSSQLGSPTITHAHQRSPDGTSPNGKGS